jgi:hypothetical protein
MTAQRRKVAILGGGMGGLAAAFQLTATAEARERFEVTVYQEGWVLAQEVLIRPEVHEQRGDEAQRVEDELLHRHVAAEHGHLQAQRGLAVVEDEEPAREQQIQPEAQWHQPREREEDRPVLEGGALALEVPEAQHQARDDEQRQAPRVAVRRGEPREVDEGQGLVDRRQRHRGRNPEREQQGPQSLAASARCSACLYPRPWRASQRTLLSPSSASMFTRNAVKAGCRSFSPSSLATGSLALAGSRTS